MGEGQTGWVIPARPGLYFARDVAKEIQRLAEGAIQQAIELSVEESLG